MKLRVILSVLASMGVTAALAMAATTVVVNSNEPTEKAAGEDVKINVPEPKPVVFDENGCHTQVGNTVCVNNNESVDPTPNPTSQPTVPPTSSPSVTQPNPSNAPNCRLVCE